MQRAGVPHAHKKKKQLHFNLIVHHTGSIEACINPHRLYFFQEPISDWEVQLPAYTTQGMHGRGN